MMETSDVVANAGKETVQQQTPNVGLTLREAREALGISVHDVAERIKFSPKQVESLEANDFAHLPQAAFLRGFVRSYARMLQLDEAALIAALPGEQAKQPAVATSGVAVPFPQLKALPRVNMFWLAGTAGVVLLLGLFVMLHEVEPPAAPAKVAVEPVPLPAPDVASAVADTTAPTQVAEPEKVAEVVKAAEPEPVKKPEPVKTPEPVKAKQPATAPAPQVAAVTPPAETTKPAIPLERLKLRPLHFVFSESTWAEVIDVNGAVLLSKTNPRDSEQWIGGPRRAPYEVTISHPENVKLYYKGKEIDLSPYAGMATARLKVE